MPFILILDEDDDISIFPDESEIELITLIDAYESGDADYTDLDISDCLERGWKVITPRELKRLAGTGKVSAATDHKELDNILAIIEELKKRVEAIKGQETHQRTNTTTKE